MKFIFSPVQKVLLIASDTSLGLIAPMFVTVIDLVAVGHARGSIVVGFTRGLSYTFTSKTCVPANVE